MRFSRTALLPLFVATAISCGGAKPPPPNDGNLGSLPKDKNYAATDGDTPTGPEPPPSAEMDQGTKAFDAGDYATAETQFVAASKKNPKDYRAWVDLGLTYEKLGKKDKAEESFKQALEVKGDLAEAAVELAALYLDAGKADDAIALCKRVLAKNANHAGLHNTLALSLAQKGDGDAALKEFEAAVKLKPLEPMFHLSIAQFMNAAKIKGAVPHLDEAQRLVKDDVAMLATIAHEYRMSGAFDECVALYDKLVAKKDSGELRTERALCKRGQKDEAGALEDLKQAVAKFPAYAAAHVYLGMRYSAMKKFKEAIAEYEAFLKAAPEDPRAADVKQKIKQAKDAMKGP
jgi:Flp pilus assembly protein TadD